MSYPPDPVDVDGIDKKIRKKLYAEVIADISFTTKSREDAEKIVTNFHKRRGVVPVGETAYSSHRGSTAVSFKVSYRVHGGWRSDFVKKMETDANDTGIAIENLEIMVHRTEIPNECPRRECPPCDFATGKTTVIPGSLMQPEREKRPKREPVTVLEHLTPETQSLWSRIRGGRK